MSAAHYIFTALVAMVVLVVTDLISTEVQGRLDRIPLFIVRLAALRVPRAMRDDFRREWTDEIVAVMHDRGRDRLPISRLLVGIRASFGWLYSARRIADARGTVPENVPSTALLLLGLGIALMNACWALPGGAFGPEWLTVSTAIAGTGAASAYVSMVALKMPKREWPRIICCALAAAASGAATVVAGLPAVSIVSAAIAAAGILVGSLRKRHLTV